MGDSEAPECCREVGKSWTTLGEKARGIPCAGKHGASLLLVNLQHYLCVGSLTGCNRKISHLSSPLVTTRSRLSLGGDGFCLLWWWAPQGGGSSVQRPQGDDTGVLENDLGLASLAKALPTWASVKRSLRALVTWQTKQVYLWKGIGTSQRCRFTNTKPYMLSDSAFIPQSKQCCIRWHVCPEHRFHILFLPQMLDHQCAINIFLVPFSPATYFAGFCHLLSFYPCWHGFVQMAHLLLTASTGSSLINILAKPSHLSACASAKSTHGTWSIFLALPV